MTRSAPSRVLMSAWMKWSDEPPVGRKHPINVRLPIHCRLPAWSDQASLVTGDSLRISIGGGLLPGFVQFAAKNAHVVRRLDADTHAVAAYLHQANGDVIADVDFFARFAAKNEHVSPP